MIYTLLFFYVYITGIFRTLVDIQVIYLESGISREFADLVEVDI